MASRRVHDEFQSRLRLRIIGLRRRRGCRVVNAHVAYECTVRESWVGVACEACNNNWTISRFFADGTFEVDVTGVA